MKIEKGVVKKIEEIDIIDGIFEIGKNVSLIDNYAARKQQSLIILKVSSNVEKIGTEAFYLCSNLKDIQFKNGIKYIGKYAFNKCINLADLVIPSSVETIEEGAFSKCHKLNRVVLEAGIKRIEKTVFLNCENLKEIIIPSSVEYLGNAAFWGCRSLEHVTLPKGLESISGTLFSECINLKEIHIPRNVGIISTHAFSGCTALKKISLPAKVGIISNNAFENCISLEEFKASKNLKNIEMCAFRNCESLIRVDLTGVSKIGPNAFADCHSLKEVVFSNGLMGLYIHAFSDCYSLEKINLPGSITHLGDYTFSNCTNLRVVEMQDGVPFVSTNMFKKCQSLEEVNLPSSILYISTGAFLECQSLNNVIIPSSVKSIGDLAFSKCGSLEDILLEDGISQIGERAFEECISLSEIEIPSSVESIDKYAFSKCEDLRTITLKEGLNTLGEGVFSNCQSLEKVEVPSSVEIIGESCFEKCISLNEITIKDGVSYINDSAFSGCSCLKKVNFPKSVKRIGSSVFSYCNNLKEVTIYSTTSINDQTLTWQGTLNVINPVTGEVKIFENSFASFIDTKTEGFLMCENGVYKFFDMQNKWVEISKEEFHKYDKKNLFNPSQYKRLYEWMKRRKFLPNYAVIENMPINEIDNFYVNNNSKRWKELLLESKIDSLEERQAFFKLCYVLGLFDQKGSVSEYAYSYIKKHILKNVKNGEYHVLFGELDTYNKGYNKEFAMLFFKHYAKNKDFLTIVNPYSRDLSIYYLASTYNNFDKIKEVYPNKVVNTNTIMDELTPLMCIKALSIHEYKGVNKDNEEFAKNIAMYGYNQNDFERVQRLFDIGKRIPKEKITLHINEDDANNIITYELLDKDNPLGVILGNITNCCQTINGLGKSCLEYGLSQRNSKFMVFRKDDKIIGQSWVWYDEKTKKICLDNIEIPKSVLNEVNTISFKREFIECLKRMTNNFLVKMKEKGLQVSSITIGEGYNDVKELLKSKFRLSVDQATLTGYEGYSDAENQFTLYNKIKR